MKNEKQLDMHMNNSFHEADAIPPTSKRPTLEPDAYPGNPYSVRNMSSLAHDPIQPQFESELPTHQDLGFTDQLEMELWLGLEITRLSRRLRPRQRRMSARATWLPRPWRC